MVITETEDSFAWKAKGKNHLTEILPLAPNTHHWEFPVSKPHDPSGSLGGSAPARHRPGYDAARPPRKSSQLPPNQLADAKTTAVLQPEDNTNHPLHINFWVQLSVSKQLIFYFGGLGGNYLLHKKERETILTKIPKNTEKLCSIFLGTVYEQIVYNELLSQ